MSSGGGGDTSSMLADGLFGAFFLIKNLDIAIGGDGAKAQKRWRRIVSLYESSMDDKSDLWFSAILRFCDFCKSDLPLRTDSKSPRMCGDAAAIGVPTGEERWSNGGAMVAEGEVPC
ncbi:hypothetical protein U1Q18_030486 [Sarracenia purpurea var. burkii]